MSDPQQPNDEKLKSLADSLSEELGSGPGSKKVDIPSASTNVGASATPQTPVAPQTPEPAASPQDDEEVPLDILAMGGTPAPQAAPAAEEKKAEPKAEPDAEVLSLDDLDKILNDADPNFVQKMTTLGQDLSTSQVKMDLKLLKLDKEVLGITDKEEQEAKAKRLPFHVRAVNAIVKGTNIGIDRMTDFTVNSAITIRDKSKEIPPLLRRIQKHLKDDILEFLAWYKSRSRIQKINLFLLVAAGFALVIVVGRTIQGLPILRPNKFPLLRSFEEVATSIETLKVGEPMEQFDSPLRNPEYVVLYNKMFVNLKAQGSSRNPMAAFEIFIEASSQESAIEIKDRERQFKDVIARVFESIPYDEVVTAEGKAKLKLILRRDLNQVLNKGRVKKVYFKTFFYKQ